MTIVAARDQFSEVLDERRRWRPDWYQWIAQLERSVYASKAISGPGTNVVIQGADPTGNGDSFDVIQETWNKNGLIYLPKGVYRTSETLVCPALAGAGLIGDGSSVTTILGDFDGTDVVQANNGFGMQFNGLNITRPGLATGGAGLNMNPTGVAQDNALLYDLHLSNNDVGIQMLSPAGWSRAQFIRSENNASHGFLIMGQWHIQDAYSSLNGGNGYVLGSPIGGDVVGVLRGLTSFNNSNTGFAAFGSGADVSSRIRIVDSLFVQDGSTEMFFSTGSQYPIILENVQAIFPQSGSGIFVDSNNPDFHLHGCIAVGPTSGGNGLFWDCPNTLFIHGGQFSGNAGGNGLIGDQGNASIHGAKFSTLGGTSLGLFSPMVNTVVIGCQFVGGAPIQTGTGINYVVGSF